MNNVLGIYSYCGQSHTGIGTTMKRGGNQAYYYVTRSDIDEFKLQPLNQFDIPSGVVIKISKKEFLSNYSPEPGYYEKKSFPALKSLEAKILKGEDFFENGKLDEAEKEFAKALTLEPENARANLGMGSVQSTKGNFKKLEKILKILLSKDEAFLTDMRKQFNTFAISLRKQSLYEHAERFYQKAIELNSSDENLHFNLSRVFYDMGRSSEALQEIDIVLDINPEMEWAHKFKTFIEKRA